MRAKWYVVVWRLLWWPLMAVGIGLAFVGIFCAYGPRDARRFWQSL